jgi:hypothetical protein
MALLPCTTKNPLRFGSEFGFIKGSDLLLSNRVYFLVHIHATELIYLSLKSHSRKL